MRRKSERNKGKSSPEKKPEKPTRKSTRRRAKKSPSTSPERSNSGDGDGLIPDKESSVNYKIQTRMSSKEIPPETLVEEPESKVSSTDQLTGDVDVEGGSVWKVARADASPGEIQKLKLCRQRNLSETSDVSLTRKRMNKWHEGEGIAEEADSADERPATSNDKTYSGNIALADDTSSTTLERESGEEVSDSKEIPPEPTLDLSDVKPNIDQGHAEAEAEAEAQPQLQPEAETSEGIHEDQERCQIHGDVDVEKNVEIPEQQQSHEQDQEQEREREQERELEQEQKQEQEQEQEQKQEKVQEQELQVKEAKKLEDESRTSEKQEETVDNDSDVKEKCDDVKEDEQGRLENSRQDVDVNQVIDSIQGVDKNHSDDDKCQFKDSGRRNSENSNDESERPSRTRSSRRKHRDKYRDSSNSDSGESEEEHQQTSPKIKSPKIEVADGEDKEESHREESVEENRGKTEVSVDEGKQNETVSSAVENNNSPVREEKEANVARPAKVNLKRSFTSRISIDECKKDDAGSTNDTSQDKENHSVDEPKSIPKRRRWGTALSTDMAPVLSISTDSLKALVPGAKPLSINEVRLSKDDEEDRDRGRKDKRQVMNDGDTLKANSEIKNDISKDNHIGVRRKISIVKDAPQLLSPSPPVVQPTSNILLIKNLVRPFTLNQIKELLSRTGTIVENGFWMDRIKSKCFVEYANEDQAFETRQALHGISWPTSNPKKLQVEYSVKEEMDKAKESSKDQPLSRKLETSSGTDSWQQDWGREGKSNAAATKVTVVREWDLGKEDGQHLLLKDKEKEKKDTDKKRRQRSRSPTLEAHLPAPARKFKKKEDEPPPAKLLDDLFRKTKATPCIYWLPLTNEQIVVKEEMRRQHMAEHARRLEEMRRAERNRDGRRRRSPRK
ncbi:apoptotic chromatin condensation inducer in the nucleus [Fopius arisanus]|uniref:Apoptotic chromatin condensation inducer in the nucleus n=1 Tax=Fopius arisanus TaxID=64838 RepID=A0A9R1U2B9_9HYME|nr:PREDICTED: apoptotic chromatin condensation inducer in the nucleus [Fopius arisanus]XP_011304606.1 PREDICTED: apoptotic chromatin condensation inducer in the nucleus [Fopius arisanus]